MAAVVRGRKLNHTARIVVWNIRAGGGRREADIAAQLLRWRADVVMLSEFRGTPPSQALAARLADAGLIHQRTTASKHLPARNALFVGARWPLRRLRFATQPNVPERWLPVRVAVRGGASFSVAALHAPNYATGLKYAYYDSVLALAARWQSGPAIIAGDTNSTLRALDEENPNASFPEEYFLNDFGDRGWHDVYRCLHGRRRVYTLYSPNANNGYRLDQAFANASMLQRVNAMRYRWGHCPADPRRRDALSDHSAMLLDMSVSPGRFL